MKYDLCVIGAGWAGFNAALKAVRLGKKVCIVDYAEIGG
ncbi:MAG TPA: FAD-dependent oxidoreductase, partial [Candidatus Omnitrophota bacterium]|nr:FAD-dependent oxidoreductase [Candidatus Omnitrophota bacterium]